MRKDITTIFRNLAPIEPRAELAMVVLGHIRNAERRAARLRLVFLGGTTIASLAAFFPAFQYTSEEFAHTSFWEYLSLVFADGGAVLTHWHQLMLLLAESFPIFATTVVLLFVFILLGSVRLALQSARIAFLPTYSS